MTRSSSDARCVALLNETVGIGGAETLILQLADELSARGRKVVCVLPESGGWLTDQMKQRGFPVYTFQIRHPFDSRLVRQLSASLASEGVDVLHSHEFAMAVFGTAVAGTLRRPHVVTMHGNQTILDRLRHRVLLRWAFRNSRAAIAVSEDTRRYMAKRMGLPANAIQVIQNGVPVRVGDRTLARRSLGIADDELLLLGTGSLVERKGFQVLIDALAQLSQGQPSLPQWHLAIAGEGSYRNEIESRIRKAQLADRVSLLGYRSDIPDLQAGADLFVMPSLWEGLPLAVLEAMCAGNPVVASRTSGIPEAIRDSETGLLVQPGQVDALANALGTVMTDPDLRLRLGSRAREVALSRFTVSRMADDYERLYWSDLASSAGGVQPLSVEVQPQPTRP